MSFNLLSDNFELLFNTLRAVLSISVFYISFYSIRKAVVFKGIRMSCEIFKSNLCLN